MRLIDEIPRDALVWLTPNSRPTVIGAFTRMLNRQRQAEGQPKINAKRMLRVMQANNNHTLVRPPRPAARVPLHVRSCSDHFELACRNGEIVRVLFAIDPCDLEIIAWSATTAGVSREMVRDLLISCVARRWGVSKVPHPIEWLSDNGSAYIAEDTLDTATALGLRLCFTPVRSQESNDISEAFVKTAERGLCSPLDFVVCWQLGSTISMRLTRTRF
jgi:putative transposase